MRARLAWALSLAVALVLGTLAFAQVPATTVISDIRQESAGDSTRLVVVSNGPLTYTYYSPDPLTLIVDLPDVDVSKVPARLNVATSEVESLRVTPMTRGEGRGLARLEVRLAHRAPYSIYSKDNLLNLVFEKSGGGDSPAPADTKTADASTATAPAPAAPSSASASGSGRPVVKASRILGVSEQAGGITVRADGHLRYQDFFLGNPDRLVVDFRDVSSGPAKTLDAKGEPIKKIRLAQFSATSPKVARLVLELSKRTPYHVVEATDGMRIVFGEGEAPSPAPLAALRSDAASEPITAAPVVAAPPASSTAGVIVPVSMVASAPLSGPPDLTAAPLLDMPSTAVMASPQDDSGGGGDSAAGSVAFQGRSAGGDKKFTGHPISLDFKDGDLQDIFRLFADISGLNVVVNPGVSGKVTLKLVEVPWDQALDLILKTNGLGYTLDDNVIRIAKLSDLQREESDRRKLQEEKALAGDLIVWRKSLSYAKAAEVMPTLKKVALSSRGSITLDSRTNMMIITDLPAHIEKAKDLILDLDRATPQVEIEARIVVTTRNFTRDIGIQWGFLNQRTTQFGNTTDMTFPHSIILNGEGVPSTLGLPPDQFNGLSSTAGIGPAVTGRGYAVNLPSAAVNSALGVSMGNILGSFNLDAALTALESSGRGRILSTPKVTTQNNQAAEIKQGIQIAVQSFSSTTGPSVNFKDVDLILKVTPQITQAGTVILGLEVENNSADFSRQVNGVPPINVQAVKTNVLVRDGSTAVIGGIYQSTEQVARNNTPLLGDLPVLGYLFRNKSLRTDNSELILFITPRIIKG